MVQDFTENSIIETVTNCFWSYQNRSQIRSQKWQIFNKIGHKNDSHNLGCKLYDQYQSQNRSQYQFSCKVNHKSILSSQRKSRLNNSVKKKSNHKSNFRPRVLWRLYSITSSVTIIICDRFYSIYGCFFGHTWIVFE